MAELVDARDLKSLGLARAGSIPAVRTISGSAIMMGLQLWEWVLIAAGAVIGYGIVKKMNK